MALRDRLEGPRNHAIPAIPAIRRDERPQPPPTIARIATIAASRDAVMGEIRTLLLRQMPEAHQDFPEALQLALANPAAHLEGLRASTPAPAWAMRGRNG